MPKPISSNPSTQNKKKKRATPASSVSKFFTVLSNIFSIGITTAASTTVALASDAAATASDYTVKPFHTLVKSATQKYFAPQIAYSNYSIRWNMTGRKRAATATDEVIFARGPEIATAASGGVARRDSLAKPSGVGECDFLVRSTLLLAHGLLVAAVRTGIGPPRSSSVPVLTALDIPDLPARRRKPTLVPINTNLPIISLPRSDSSPSPSSPMAFTAFHNASPSSLGTPLLSASYSGSEASYSQPSTPRLSCSALPSSPLRHVASRDTSENIGHQQYRKSIPVARFSFWNLVGLAGEDAAGNKEAGGEHKSEQMDQGRLCTAYEREEDGSDEEQESYKRLCYI